MKTMNWIKSDQIALLPHCHSTAMEMKPLLLAIPGRAHAREGYYFGGLMQEWREGGSPSEAHPTHWMPMPVAPANNLPPDAK